VGPQPSLRLIGNTFATAAIGGASSYDVLQAGQRWTLAQC